MGMSTEDYIWEAIEQARLAGWDAERLLKEIDQAWTDILQREMEAEHNIFKDRLKNI